MNKEKNTTNTALVETHPKATEMERRTFMGLAGVLIRTPAELAERIREIQGQCHLLSPVTAVASIAPGYAVNPVVVVIDPSVDMETGAGAEVYHQFPIHKRRKSGDGFVPLEVSLNKNGLMKILQAVGVNAHPLHRHDDGRTPNYWMVEATGDVTDFDGKTRRLPPGLVEVDLRDGSPQIGGWTPEKWAESVKAARAKAGNAPANEQWKFRPDPINGWTEERVMQARRFGLRLAATKATNAMVRGLGIKQKYTIDELGKPFVALRAQWFPDMSDPEVKRLVTAAKMNASQLLYPHAITPLTPGPDDSPISHGLGDPTTVVDVFREEPRPALVPTKTDAPPEDSKELDFSEPSSPRYKIQSGRKSGDGVEAKYFFTTEQGDTLFTTDIGVARTLDTARRRGVEVAVETERIKVQGKAYQSVINIEGAETE